MTREHLPDGPVELLLSKLTGVAQSGAGWKALCPAHADKNPSLSIAISDGKILLHCFAGCSTENVMGAIGLDLSLLFAPEDNIYSANNGAQTGRRTGWQTLRDAAEFVAQKSAASIEATYEYPGIDGSLQFAVVRLTSTKGKTFRPLHCKNGRWNIGDPDRLLPLFGLPALISRMSVLVVEGEKCALAANKYEATATTSAHGANSAAKTDWNYVANKHVTIWPDNDAAGQRYARDVVRILRTINPDVQIRMIQVGGLPEGGDIVDWIEAQKERGLADEEIAILLQELIDGAVPVADGDFAGSTYSTGPTPGSGDWLEPKPLPKAAPPVPFPLYEAFPASCGTLRDYIAAVAHSYQVPIDLPALLAIAAFALTIAKCFEVVGQKDWKEVLGMYVLIVLPSGERKSAVFARMIGPIYHWQEVQAGAMAADLNSHQNEIAVLKEKIRREKRKAADDQDDEDDEPEGSLDDLTRNLAEMERSKPTPPSLIASEATTESIADMLVENAERGMLAAPEGDAIDVLLGRYGQGRPNFGLWLNGHSGDAFAVRRKGRPTLLLRRPVLCVALTVQPVAAEELMQSPQAEGRGILARFLYAYPTPMVGHREMEPTAVPIELTDWYGARLQELLDRPVPPEPELLYLTIEAKQLLLAFRKQVEVDLREGGALHDRQAWGSKLPGAILRVAAVLHVVAHRGRGEGSIDATTMKAALAWAPYLSEHERRATSAAAENRTMIIAQRIVSWLQRGALAEFDHNQCFNGVRCAAIQEAKDIDAALHLLEDCHWIRTAALPARPPGKAGRPRSTRYLVNPAVSNSGKATQNTQNTRNQDAGPEGES